MSHTSGQVLEVSLQLFSADSIPWKSGEVMNVMKCLWLMHLKGEQMVNKKKFGSLAKKHTIQKTGQQRDEV